ADGERFITPGLELLAEIQRTGDIFFPSNWTGSMLWGHRSPRAAAMVHDFLAKELQYPERLRWTVLSSADDLFRAAARSGRRPARPTACNAARRPTRSGRPEGRPLRPSCRRGHDRRGRPSFRRRGGP